MWVVEATIGIPPPTETVTGKCTGIMTRSQLNIADIASYIIEAVWNDHPFSKAIEIMIIGSQCFQRIQMAFAIEVAHIFLLLGIHTDNRIPGSFILSFQTLNVFKLLIAVWHRFHGLLLVRLPATIVVLLQQFAHHRLTDGNPMVHLERCANLSHRQICPADGRIHRVARRMVMENVQKLLVDVDPRLLIRFAASAGNPNASIHFGLGQLADFFGAFAHRPTTTPQHPGNVTSSAVPILERLDTGITALVFFGQTLVKSLHTLFNFWRVRLHFRIPSGARLTTCVWHLKDTRSNSIGPNGHVIKFSFLSMPVCCLTHYGRPEAPVRLLEGGVPRISVAGIQNTCMFNINFVSLLYLSYTEMV